jgi:asparagine synthase (glutamine-hydrolysing)
MVYNGEIYNFAALRCELEAAGHAFATRSDSEVVLTGYRHWGEAVLDKLDGMFAFAIHDLADGSVFLARDRVGIKPLFWGEHAGGLVVASTLAPFFALRDFPKQAGCRRPARLPRLPDPAGAAYPGPRYPCPAARHLPALETGYQFALRTWDSASRARHASGGPFQMPPKRRPIAEALAEETDLLLARAVKDQLVADVPLGAFLSGGIDSSLIVHYMAQAGATSRPLKTFSVRFAEAGFDESPAARAVAEKYGTEHHVLDAPELGADTLAAALADLDQPLADPAYIPTWALSRLTRQHVTVALSGDGGDELFGGYPRFLDSADRHPDSALKHVLRFLLRQGLAPASLTRRALAGAELLLYRRVELGDYPGSRKDLRRYLAPDVARAARPEHTLELWRELAKRHGNYDRGALLRADLWTYLSENCLAKTDRASMAHGLEVRVPLAGQCAAGQHAEASGRRAFRRRRRQGDPARAGAQASARCGVESRKARLLGAVAQQLRRPVARLVRRPGRGLRMRAPWLDAGAIAALWREARQGEGNPRLFYTFAVLLAWLEKHPLEA